MSPESRTRLRNFAAIALVLAAAVCVTMIVRGTLRPPPGGSERDESWLVCTQCQAESEVSSKVLETLGPDEATSAYRCPKCGALAAYRFSLRCPSCQRAIPITPDLPGKAFVCPFCQAPMSPDEPETAPPASGTEAQPVPSQP